MITANRTRFSVHRSTCRLPQDTVINVEFTNLQQQDSISVWSINNVLKDVLAVLDNFSVCYTWSEWASSSHKRPIGWLMALKMEATPHLLYWDHVVMNTSAKHAVSVFREPVMPTVSMKFSRYVRTCVFLNMTTVGPQVRHEYSEKSHLILLTLICTFFPYVCFFLTFFFFF